MKNNKTQAQKSTHFDSSEYWNEIENAITTGKVKSVPNVNKMKLALAKSARNTRLETKQVNIRMNSLDISKLKAKALSYGMPYQTLLNSLVHRFVSGKITL